MNDETTRADLRRLRHRLRREDIATFIIMSIGMWITTTAVIYFLFVTSTANVFTRIIGVALMLALLSGYIDSTNKHLFSKKVSQ